MPRRFTRRSLEAAYARYNHRRFVEPDPLQFLFGHEDLADREIVGLIAAGLAYGRVAQILRSVDSALSRMGEPAAYVRGANRSEISRDFRSFKHRFTTGKEVASLLAGIKAVLEEHGSLGDLFASLVEEDDATVLAAAEGFVTALDRPSRGGCGSLLAAPSKKSACKRLNLYLRWMVRKDDVDPGGWDPTLRPRLIVPLDTHMHRVSLEHGLTTRKSADLATALEITAGFARFSPDDPVKYDFALTRPGIRGEG